MSFQQLTKARILWILLLGAILIFGHGLREGAPMSPTPTRSLVLTLPEPSVQHPSALPAVESGVPALEPDADLFESPQLPRIRIELSRAAIGVLRGYQWNWGGRDDRPEVKGTIYEGDRIYTNVAIHPKGSAGSFRSIDDKPALTLNFDKFAPGQKFHGLKKIHLNNSVQDGSYLAELISREICLAAGVPTTRAAHAMVSINNRNLGLYVLIEGWNKQFLKRHFKNPDGVLYDGGFASEINDRLDVLSGDKETKRADLKAVVNTMRKPVDQRFALLDKLVDVDRFLSFVAMESMLSHGDGYVMNRNNYRVYHDPDTDRLVFMPHGMDQMFGRFNSTTAARIIPPLNGQVAQTIIGSPEGQARYLERFGTLYTNVYKTEIIHQRLDDMAARLRPYVAEEGDWAIQSFRQSVADLRRRIEQRGKSLAHQLGAKLEILQFPPSGEVLIKKWQPREDQGNATYNRHDSKTDEGLLVIEANGGTGSWRSQVTLPPGTYEFVGRALVDGIEVSPNDPRSGVGLRHSGAQPGQRIRRQADWTELRHEIEVRATLEIELICEIKAIRGKAVFDANSLKLVRK